MRRTWTAMASALNTRLGFSVQGLDGKARAGVLRLPRQKDGGDQEEVLTPACMMCTKQGAPPVLMAHLIEDLPVGIIHLNAQGM